MSPPVRITDNDAPQIAVFRNVKERDIVGRAGLFIAEGATVLSVLLRSRLETLAILVEENRAQRMDVLNTRGAAPLFVAPQNVLDGIAGFHLHRGILAAGRIPPSFAPGDLPQGPLRLPVLVGLANHDNVGGVYRNAAAFGAAAVAIDPTTADPFYRKSIRVGVGAPLLVPTIRAANIGALLAELARQHITPYALSPGAAAALSETTLAPRAAFLFGAEGEGLHRDLLDAATPLRIPIHQGFDSLNVATTSGIVLHAHAAIHGIGHATATVPFAPPAL